MDNVTVLLREMQPEDRRELVEREVKDKASPDEQQMLRREDNLAAWRAELTAFNRSLEDQLASRKKRLAERHRLYENYPDNPDIRHAYLEEEDDYEEWKPAVGKLKEAVEARLSENKALRQNRHQQQMPPAGLRDALVKAREFIASEEAVVYRFWPERDELLEQIDRALGGGPGSFKEEDPTMATTAKTRLYGKECN